jgi:hypothetical protein
MHQMMRSWNGRRLPDLRPTFYGRMGILDFVALAWNQPQSSATFPNIFTFHD